VPTWQPHGDQLSGAFHQVTAPCLSTTMGLHMRSNPRTNVPCGLHFGSLACVTANGRTVMGPCGYDPSGSSMPRSRPSRCCRAGRRARMRAARWRGGSWRRQRVHSRAIRPGQERSLQARVSEHNETPWSETGARTWSRCDQGVWWARMIGPAPRMTRSQAVTTLLAVDYLELPYLGCWGGRNCGRRRPQTARRCQASWCWVWRGRCRRRGVGGR